MVLPDDAPTPFSGAPRLWGGVGAGTLSKDWLCQSGLCHGEAPAPTHHGPASPILRSQLGQDCKSVNILFIISITLLHYSLFNSPLFYY